MNRLIFIDRGLIVASIMKTKYLYFNELFVTKKELLYIGDSLKEKISNSSIDICISNDINKYYYKIDEVISLNKNKNINIFKLEKEYMDNYIPSDILDIICDNVYICDLLIKLKKEEIKTRSDQLREYKESNNKKKRVFTKE